MNTLEMELLAAAAASDEPRAERRVSAVQPLDSSNREPAPLPMEGALVGTLIGFKDCERTPLVLYPGQRGSAALAAASIVDVNGSHLGHQVVLVFEKGDASRPIIMGLLRGQQLWPLAETPGQVDVDADGARLTVSARQQLVLRCGKASITLTRSGKVLIRGEYVSSSSSGVMRIKGGSVQMN